MPAQKPNKIKSVNSPKGHEIALYELVKDKKLPNLFLLGVFHGDEIEGEYILNKLMDELAEEIPHALAFNLYILPCLNPDGKEAGTRVNGRGIDLNRNYPTANFKEKAVSLSGYYSAGEPASEAETRFMIDLIETFKPKRIMSIHSDLHLVDYDGPARDLALRIANLTGYKFVENVGYPTNGSFGTWAGIERQIPLITLETWEARTPENLEKAWQEVRPALYDFICNPA